MQPSTHSSLSRSHSRSFSTQIHSATPHKHGSAVVVELDEDEVLEDELLDEDEELEVVEDELPQHSHGPIFSSAIMNNPLATTSDRSCIL